MVDRTVVALAFLTLAGAPLASGSPSLAQVPATGPFHHSGSEVPEREYNWTAFYEETPSTEPPIVINGVKRPANDPLIVEGHFWNHRNASPCHTPIEISNSENIIIRGNEFYWVCYAIVIQNSRGITIEENYFQDTRSNPIDARSSSEILVEHNVMQGIQLWVQAPIYWVHLGNAASFFFGVSDVTFQFNRVQSHQAGVSFSAPPASPNSNVIVHGNVFEDTVVAAGFDRTNGGEFKHNLVNGFTRIGLNVLSSDNILAHNNTFLAFQYRQETVGVSLSDPGWTGFRFIDSTGTLRHNDMWANYYGYVGLGLVPAVEGFAVSQIGAGSVDAKENWWGSPAPPGIPPSGAVRGNVQFILWSLQPHHPIPAPPPVTRFDADHQPPCPRSFDSRVEFVLGFVCPVWPLEPPTP